MHRYWSIVENRRVRGGRTVQRQVLYLGEINDCQKESWRKTIDVFESGSIRPKQISLYPSDRELPVCNTETIKIRLDQLELRKARQWGACWLSCVLWEELKLDDFWRGRLRNSRKGTNWKNLLQTMVSYYLIDPGSEWRLHRQWYEESAMGDLLGEDFGLVQIDKLYRCLDKLVEHKRALFSFLKKRWETMFNAKFDVLLYDLTSTYFECEAPEQGLRKFGYSRDKRSDCVQVVIALIVTPEGLPLAYEVMPGNTKDSNTLSGFLKKIEEQYGTADRIWVMDRGIPTEETLKEMRKSSSITRYLVGTPKGRLSKLESSFLDLPWQEVRQSVRVKILNQEEDVYVLASSEGRINKERAMRRRRFKRLWKRLGDLRSMKLTRDELLLKLGAARKEAGRVWGLVNIGIPKTHEEVSPKTFNFSLDKSKLRITRRREGQYLLRTNIRGEDPAVLWQHYMQLTEVEQAFKELKNDLSIRPIYHQRDDRIEAHIFIAFLAYCLSVTLKQKLKTLAPGLTSRAVIEKFRAMQMIDVHLPTTDGRVIKLSRYTQPEKDQRLLLRKLNLDLPQQPPPKISTHGDLQH